MSVEDVSGNPERLSEIEVSSNPPAAKPPRKPVNLERRWVLTGLFVLGFCTLLLVLGVRIDLILQNNTPTGGDNGAHIWTPDYARRELLQQFRLTGWSNDWFSGVSTLGFYFPLPAWLIVALSFVLPYGVSFKIVTVIGIISLPLLCYRLGRRAQIGFVNAYAMGLAALPFLLLRHYRILGGNILSTMAGEYSFSISLSLTVLYMGLLVHLMRTGEGRARTALALAASGVSHFIPTMFAVFFTLGLLAFGREKGRSKRQVQDVVTSAAVGGSLAAFWLLPFAANLGLSNSMDYERNTKFFKTLFPFLPDSSTRHTLTDGIQVTCIALVLAAIAAIYGFVKQDPLLRSLTAATVISGVGFRVAPQGALWNNRLLPLWFFGAYLLGSQGLVLSLRFGHKLIRRRSSSSAELRPRSPKAAVLVGAVLTYVLCGPAFSLVPGQIPFPLFAKGGIRIEPLRKATEFKKATMPFGWAASNAAGAESKPGWSEFHSLMNVLNTLPPGRALWEFDRKTFDRYGTGMALMSIPYWTKSRIGSSEGLFFEASATTPFHFLTAALVSAKPSNPQRRLPYKSFSIDEGVDRMRSLGMRYYMAVTPTSKLAADNEPSLKKVAASGPYVIYEISNFGVVSALTEQPVVATGIDGTLNGGFIDLGVALWSKPDLYPANVALTGPRDWERIRIETTAAQTSGTPSATSTANKTDTTSSTSSTKAGSTAGSTSSTPKAAKTPTPLPKRGADIRVASFDRTPLPPVTVSDVVVKNESVRFTVDKIGVPVLVRISYFPNWKAHGATGPYRTTPNFMIVVPTQNEVRLDFDYAAADKVGWVITLTGIGGLAAVWAFDRKRRRNRVQSKAAAE